MTELSDISHQAFYGSAKDDESKSTIAFSTLSIFLTDMYLLLTRYIEKSADIIKYKTNANIYSNLNDLVECSILFNKIPLRMDQDRHCMYIYLNCNDANAHKISALLIKEFEHTLIAFEDIFKHIGLQLYYIRAKITAYGSDNVDNYNFEAYTPTLITLLSGGRVYSTRMVFLRELVQNAIDAIEVRNYLYDSNLVSEIMIFLNINETGNISTIRITDNGIGMNKMDIERYFTNIGRSFYTAEDFKKMNLAYQPISYFGIGFLSCFLVSDIINVRTHNISGDSSYEITVPNIEGCFFIEKSKKQFPTGTQITITVHQTQEAPITIDEVFDYATRHLLDIKFDIKLYWNSYNFIPAETNFPLYSYRNSQNKYIEKRPDHTTKKLKYNIDSETGSICYTINKYAVREAGKIFFLFIPNKATVTAG